MQVAKCYLKKKLFKCITCVFLFLSYVYLISLKKKIKYLLLLSINFHIHINNFFLFFSETSSNALHNSQFGTSIQRNIAEKPDSLNCDKIKENEVTSSEETCRDTASKGASKAATIIFIRL